MENANPVSVSGRTYHVMLSHAEHATHLGSNFTALIHRKMAVDEFIDITMTVPAGYTAHFNYAIDTALETQLEVFKDSVLTGGTVNLARNRDEGSSNINTVSIRKDGTVTAVGVVLANITWGTTATPVVGPSAGGADTDNEILWPENAVRRFRVTSKAAANNVVIRLNFIMVEVQ